VWKRNEKDSLINQQYYMQEGNKTVCKVVLRGVTGYELWIDKECVKRGSTFEEVKDEN